ncbi:glycosyltransferase [Ekhidna sp. MALMAid0563]|uniref:glycosyltransferase n=1 Tax=Ekhidna sp. MALMAid0563 TaxID=3143937 RepID=UPI0032DEE105
MIWIASYPGSGIEFLEKVLKKAFGVSVYAFINENNCLDNKQRFISTHNIPSALPKKLTDCPSIYLVRDGRDAIGQLASQQQAKSQLSPIEKKIFDLIQSDYRKTDGGWSINAALWIKKSALVIRYEDLIQEPEQIVEKISRSFSDLPTPDLDSLAALKADKIKFDNLPRDLETIFCGLHGDIMNVLGYHRNRTLVSKSDFDKRILDYKEQKKFPKKRILIEASTLLNKQMDGTRRYVDTLLRSLYIQQLKQHSQFEISVRTDNIYPLGSLFKDVSPSGQKKKGLINGVIVFIVAFPRKLKNRLSSKSLDRMLSISKILGFLKLYQKAIALFNYRLVKKYENNKLDLIHFTLPQRAIKRNISHRSTCTIHDLTCKLFPQFHPHHSIKTTHRSMLWIKNKVSNFISVSDHTKDDLIKHYEFNNDTITTIYEAIDHELFYPDFNPEESANILTKHGINNTEYFFSLCTLEPRKNLKNVLLAFISFCEKNPSSTVRFVLSGGHGWMMSELPTHSKIIQTGYLPDDELSVLYAHAICNCYVSFYEGFGLPPLEAMRCKTISIYGNNSSMKELIGDAGLAANPHSIEDICDQMEKIAFNSELRSSLERKAFEKSWMFTVDKLGQDTLRYYNQIMS